MNFLQRRQGLLDAVVFSGGEPTLHGGLKQAVTAVRELGFKVGLHTNGAYPSHLDKLLPQLSWVGMDIKSEFSDYEKVTGIPSSGEKVRESAMLLLASGVPYEFRTTVHPAYHTTTSLLKMAQELQQLGAQHYMLQEFRPQGCADARLTTNCSNQDLLNDSLLKRIGAMFKSFSVRHA
jgi:anaerobic ribonucleoside-triphosphate reductase activating protein